MGSALMVVLLAIAMVARPANAAKVVIAPSKTECVSATFPAEHFEVRRGDAYDSSTCRLPARETDAPGCRSPPYATPTHPSALSYPPTPPTPPPS